MSFKGLATGIGSLPHKEPGPALDLIFEACPAVPFWPQLPRRDPRESMIAQFSEGFPCLRMKQKGLVFDADGRDRELELFYDRLISQDTDHFAVSENFAPGLWEFRQRLAQPGYLGKASALKLQVTGPFTFCASVNDDKGAPLLHDQVFRQAYLKGLIMKAAWQVKLFRQFGKKLILFIDEPYLSCFGSAFTPVNKEDVLAALGEFCAALAAEDLTIGIHCCGNTDWSLFTDIKDLKIINFDAFDFLDRVILYAADLKRFLERGGLLCWGIVPTQIEDKGQGLTAPALLERIRSGCRLLADKGIDEELLKERLLVSPACGLGSQGIAGCRKVFGLLSEVSRALR